MPVRQKYARFLAVLVIAASVACSAGLVLAQDLKQTTDIAVVVHPENTLTDIRLSTLRQIVLGEQTAWANHVSVNLIFRQGGTPEQDIMLRTLVRMNDSEFRQLWAAKVSRGEAASRPPIVPSAGLASEYVASHRGGIGFVRGIDLRKDLKVLKVEGLLPGSRRYPLH